jgi:CO/xanthine dehydrogenase FAD-binding subunit
VSKDISPVDDVFHSAATRRHLARVLAGRALAKLATVDKAS